MVVLGIETSCDETSVALVAAEGTILSQRIWTQVKEHQAYGGVVPEIAARAHLEKLPLLLNQVLDEGQQDLSKLDGIAVTVGPGLIGGLIVGLTFGKVLSLTYNIPLIGVNHLAGHLLSSRLGQDCPFPYLCLLVSGGHSQLILVRGLNDVTLLGQTLDDAAGEAFDKGAKILGLGFPGGPALAKAAEKGDVNAFSFSEPLTGRKGCLDFSFSGIKTALARHVEKLGGTITRQQTYDLAASYEKVIIHFLLKRLQQGIQSCLTQNITPHALVVVGGVGANQKLREGMNLLAEETKVPVIHVDKTLCTDNAAMIAWAGHEGLSSGLKSTYTMKPRPRWPLEEGFFSYA